jgi:nucleotide-binding universal stress UspA family protein
MTNPVVVGLDESPAAGLALMWGAAEAARRHRPLHLLHAHGWPQLDLPLGPDGAALQWGTRTAGAVRARADGLLADAATVVRRSGLAVEITTGARPDLPAAALIAASRTAAVVVVGSRGLGGFAGLLLGSVSIQVAAHAHSPVVVVREAAGDRRDVVVGVDGSEVSVAAIGYAFEQAAWRSGTLVAVHAWRWPVSTGPGDIAPLVYDPLDVTAEAERMLAEAVAGWHEKFPDVRVERRLVHGPAAPALVGASAHAELTVVGSRGRGGFGGLLLGSVSHQVLHHALSPVAVVRRR